MATRTLFLLLTAATALLAQTWEGLQTLPAGATIKVLDTSDREIKGSFRAATAETITVATGKAEVSVERAKVRRVQVRSGSRRARNVAIGAAIGVAIGVTVDQTLGTYLRNESGESQGARALSYIAPIGILGAIGAALPAYRTVYRVR